MRSIDGRRLGIWSLRLDAIYCALLGAGVALSAEQIAGVIAIPAIALAVVGVTVVLWAGLVLGMLWKLRLGMALRAVMGVNALAALLVAAAAIAAGTMLAAIAVLAIAVDIALFAASQALALRNMRVLRVP